MSNPYPIQPMEYEFKLLPEEQRRVDLIVDVDNAISSLDQDKIKELLIGCMELSSGEYLVKRLRMAL